MLTVMMLAYNERKMVEMAVQSFRLFSDIDISLVVVDNGSTDGLREWAAEQTDLTCVFLEEPMGWGKVINKIVQEFQINTDLLVIEGHYMLTPKCLSRMIELLHKEDSVGAVGCIHHEEVDYEALIKKADIEEEEAEGKRVMILPYGAIMWRKEAMEEVGEFEEKVDTLSLIVGDYCLRMVKADKKLFSCSNAFLWNVQDRNAIRFEKQWEREVLESKWGMYYFNTWYNERIVPMITARTDDKIAILEIGCDCGATLLEIKNRFPNAEVYGSEINTKAASIAAHFANVVVNNIESKNLPFQKGIFDYIIFGDVLEHLHDPLDILKYCKEFLRDEGSIVASIPNVMHISIMEQLMKGNFTYTETGLLDKTHIHLFTGNEIKRIFHDAGYEIYSMESYCMPISDRQKSLIDHLLCIDNTAHRFMYETFQYNVKARKADCLLSNTD